MCRKVNTCMNDDDVIDPTYEPSGSGTESDEADEEKGTGLRY